jgi:hypothetical protein
VRLAADGAPIAVKRRGVNQSTNVRTSLYKRMVIINELENLDQEVGMAYFKVLS